MAELKNGSCTTKGYTPKLPVSKTARASAADPEEMHCSNNGDEKAKDELWDALPVVVQPRTNQNLHQRAILGELTENGQCLRPSVQGANRLRGFSGSENVCPALTTGKNMMPVCVASKQSFAVYRDEVEGKNRYSCMAVEESSMCEVDTCTRRPNIHLLLSLSTGSPMLVDKSLQSQDEDLQCYKEDVMCAAEYAEDIHRYLREAEVKYRPRACYLRKQPDITSSMRAILVDWLVEVGEEYKLRTETVYLAVNYLDRFLSCMSVLRGKLQLVGTAAVLLAAKYEEIYPPEVKEFVYITDDTYTKKQLLKMEHLLLKVLAFDLTVPTINQFLFQYLQLHGVSIKTENFARYVAELSLLEADPFLKYLPSQMAAAAYCLANYTVNRHFWPDTLAAFTGYSLGEIVPCLSDLHKACLDAPHRPQQAIREKYKLAKYMQVSLLEPPAILPLL
ncbi:cyclin-A1 isoform X1 [Podarcis lilfordi]|uniref:Cyclin-A1 isoform X1 n=2 Tax=Podarcis lilfordi TaxID=74358 RepID=A0AA35K7A2_9SAUR|nr:cyclin-A1 isoform X1 [Podarcis lilfordi]